MNKSTKRDLVTMLAVDPAELAMICGGVAGASFSLQSMTNEAGTQASSAKPPKDCTDPKHEHTDDEDSSLMM